MDFDGSGLCFHFGRWYHLCAEFNGLNGTSIMESVVPRSGHLLQKPSRAFESCISVAAFPVTDT